AYQVNAYLSAKMSYLMPSAWVSYTVEAGETASATDRAVSQNGTLTRPVWMNYAGFTLNGHLRLSNKMEAVAEAGAALVTRKGFATESNLQVIDHATYFAPLVGAGIHYRLHDSWSVVASGGLIPASVGHNQPRTTYASLGIRFKPPVAPTAPGQKPAAMIHPRQWLQVGYTSNGLGYGVNSFISGMGIFWGGRLEVEEGVLPGGLPSTGEYMQPAGSRCRSWPADRKYKKPFTPFRFIRCFVSIFCKRRKPTCIFSTLWPVPALSPDLPFTTSIWAGNSYSPTPWVSAHLQGRTAGWRSSCA
ncbi:MAG: porin family protein, partial [Bacteroidales bacterium]|nr:porin family protein [Bacteroidales bacterium]